MIEHQYTQMPGYHYLAFSPEDPYASEKKWPLVIFLHGVGERGTDLNVVARQGLPRLLRQRKMFPFVTAAPQLPHNEYWIPSLVEEVIPQVASLFPIDEDRIYLTGISMGGYGVWMTAVAFPDRFAAIAPICGGGEPGTVKVIKNVPAWVFHGAKDPVVPVAESEAMAKALKKAGGEVRLTIYPEGGHDVWTETYNNEELYQWFLSHDRKAVLREKAS